MDAKDRSIACTMKLPYLFAVKDGMYMAGPMLQSAEWFNLYLHPLGFEMIEEKIPAAQVAEYLKKQKTAMLGLQVEQNGKHAVVYVGTQGEKLLFVNNKWVQSDAPERIELAEEELLNQIMDHVMIATIRPIPPCAVDLTDRIHESQNVIRRNVREICELCKREESVGTLRAKMNTLFRPLLLDGITMLNLLCETELADRFSVLQASFLSVLKDVSNKRIKLGDYLNCEELKAAAARYVELIEQELW